ncbi:hypothetical protein ROLI_022850 [Roseobacter fucihabitans]|uniref:SGNH hydrolase-type esterase domain-containing protein n=1 Tax=Roseobacter fucihabitans TaxID=1537242 RepID=A0ABZ2BVL3_9RHOB|nr:SGNH/GDSL hydrolase family protein [Roseobacter litoralis]MBC6967475.1 hypothetical protein [Roseobacter litoralis]
MLAARLLQVGLSPVLALQALMVIARTPKLPEAGGVRCGRVGCGPVLRLLIVGDSSAAGVGVRDQSEALSGQLIAPLSRHCTVDWHLVAMTGMTTRAMPEHLRRSCQGDFDVAVTALGVNDVTRLVNPDKWVAQTRAFHQMLRRDYGIEHIFVTSVPPMGRFPALPFPLSGVLGAHAEAMRSALDEELKTQEACRLVDPGFQLDPEMMARDGFHPGPALYARWGEVMARQIRDDLAIKDQ